MKRAWLAVLAASSVLLGALVVAAPEASAALVKQPNGHYISVALPSGVAPSSVPGSVAAARHAAGFSLNGNLDYHGGAVMHSSAPYLIFWTPSGETIPSSTESLLQRYFADVSADSGTSSNVYGVDRQFYDGTGSANYSQSFSSGQAIVDTQPYPTTGRCSRTSGSHPTCLTDNQLQAEVQRLIAADGLPTDGPSSTQLPDSAPIYFVVLPADVNQCSSGTQCADNVFCAYHSSLVDGANNVLYASIPLLPATGKGCQFDGNSNVQSPNGDSRADIAMKYMSHEDNETITDPVVGGGWYDSNTGNEDGDNCNSINNNPNAFIPTLGGTASAGTLYNQLIGGNEYYIQSEWSNGDVNCEMRPSPPTGTANFAAQPSSGNSVLLTINNSFSSATWNFGDGSASFYNAGTEPSPLGHIYGAPGTYNITLTTVDHFGNVSSSTQAVTVGASTGGGTGTGGGGGTGGGTGTGGGGGGGTGGGGGVNAPSAAFNYTPQSPGTGQPVFFNASGSSSPGRSVVTYSWNFGDGRTGSGAKPTHTYTKTGTYTVRLAIVDSAGQMAFVSHNVTVSKAGVTKVTASNKKAGGATVLITVNAPGKVQFGSKSLRANGAGTLTLRLKLSAARQRTLSTTHRLSLLVTIKFTPAVGKRSTKNATVVFHS